MLATIKKIILILLIIVLIGIFSFNIFIQNFEIFGKPNRIEIEAECDYEGMRKITLYKIEGNAVTNNGFILVSSYCDEKNLSSEILFSASSSNLSEKNIYFKWKSFDTVEIKYHKDFEVIEKKTISKKVNPKIIFKYNDEENFNQKSKIIKK